MTKIIATPEIEPIEYEFKEITEEDFKEWPRLRGNFTHKVMDGGSVFEFVSSLKEAVEKVKLEFSDGDVTYDVTVIKVGV